MKLPRITTLLLIIIIFSYKANYSQSNFRTQLEEINYLTKTFDYNDSIINVLSEKIETAEISDSLVAEFNLKKAKIVFIKYSLDTALKILDSNIALCEKNDFLKIKAKCYREKGVFYYNKINIKEAIRSYKKSLEIFIDNEIVSDLVPDIYYKFAQIYKVNISDNNSAFNFIEEGIKYSNKHNLTDQFLIGLIYKAKLYNRVNQFDKAILLNDSAYNTNLKNPCFNIMGGIMELYSRIYIGKKEYDKAITYCDTAIYIYRKLNLRNELSSCITIKGHIFYLQKDYKNSLKYNRKALEIRQIKPVFSQNIASSYLNIANDYYFLKEYEKSLITLDSVKPYFDGISHHYIGRYYLFKSKNYEKLNKYDKALLYYKKYKNANDKMLQASIDSEINILEYETEKLQTENELKNLRLSKAENVKTIIYLISAIFILLTLFLISIFYRKRRENKVLKTKNQIILRSQDELIIAKEKAEESDRLKSEFLANMSHDIRTPLNGIMGFSYILADEDIPDYKKPQYSSIIIKNSKLLLRLIDDIIEFSKIDAGDLSVNIKLTDIGKNLKQAVKNNEYEADNKNLKISLNNVGKKDVIIKTDPLRLQQIANNLISNAIKYTEKGKIDIMYEATNEGVEVKVKDTGIGLEKEEMLYIFDKFRRGKHFERTGKSVSGTGLGLSITKRIVEKLNGEIWVDSEIGVGSVFTFTLKNLG